MTVSAGALGAGNELEQLELRNPDGVSKAALDDGLDLYRRIMACEDPKFGGALKSAMQVLSRSRGPLTSEYDVQVIHARCRLGAWDYCRFVVLHNFP